MLIIFKKISIILVFSFLLVLSPKSYALNILDVSAQSCVLMYEDGRCIYEKNADQRQLIASTTKIMTAIVCIEECRLDENVTVKPRHCAVEGSSVYLEAGESYTVKELLLGLMLASGNDAALALADHVAGGEKAFAKLMNKKADSLGMNDSSFANPHGLDARGHYSTAKDMAILMLHCMENETFRELTSCSNASIKNRQYVNHNKLLKTYPGCCGGKTGFTEAAGRCLVSCVEKDGMRLVCVTLSAPDDWRDHSKLYDYAFDNYYVEDLAEESEFQLPVVSGSKESVSVIPGEEVKLLLGKKEKVKLSVQFPSFIFAPVKKGETAGEICVIIDSNVVAKYPLVFADDVVMAYPCLNAALMEVYL